MQLGANPVRQRHHPALITQAVTGMGGIGKTQLAVELAWRYGRFLDGVHWVDARDPAAIPGGIAAVRSGDGA